VINILLSNFLLAFILHSILASVWTLSVMLIIIDLTNGPSNLISLPLISGFIFNSMLSLLDIVGRFLLHHMMLNVLPMFTS